MGRHAARGKVVARCHSCCRPLSKRYPRGRWILVSYQDLDRTQYTCPDCVVCRELWEAVMVERVARARRTLDALGS